MLEEAAEGEACPERTRKLDKQLDTCSQDFCCQLDSGKTTACIAPSTPEAAPAMMWSEPSGIWPRLQAVRDCWITATCISHAINLGMH